MKLTSHGHREIFGGVSRLFAAAAIHAQRLAGEDLNETHRLKIFYFKGHSPLSFRTSR